ncbi:type I phosphomannose isomerase catalytic subunit [Flammeovirgaceae bacterium SG7u.111]|nr:type I phosphomannose isomerase catalytic subunit [Flammeovirgaceae bacterium SG7u.132]WPO33007.1 type I phosphomannose isomerase catalytic subunit [Flammeovirgaceae bacterium SG7u.111]
MSTLYPLKFKTIFKDKLWGGEKMKTVLGKDFSPLPNCGETWEISGVEGNISEVSEGELEGKLLTELIETYKDKLVGKKVYEKFGDEFPLLVKFIDANDDLSIQVHPDDKLAAERHNSFGKTEMWYVFQADEGSKLNAGFSKEVDKETYLKHLKENTLDEILNIEEVQADDVYFIPAGRVHYIGKGCLLAEIQQTSDVTYRIYDFDRKDDKGNARELHTEEALDAIDYKHYDQYKTEYKKEENTCTKLVTSDYFETKVLRYTGEETERDYRHLDSFVIYVCFEGKVELEYADGKITIEKGDAVLLPASLKYVKLKPKSQYRMLESYVPNFI